MTPADLWPKFCPWCATAFHEDGTFTPNPEAEDHAAVTRERDKLKVDFDIMSRLWDFVRAYDANIQAIKNGHESIVDFDASRAALGDTP